MTNHLLKNFTRYVSLNILGMIGMSCYILADTFFVANGLGADGLTALNLAIPVYSFIFGTGLMIGMGAAARFSISGQRENRSDEIFTNAAILSAIASMVFIILGIFFSGGIARLLGADAVSYTHLHNKAQFCQKRQACLNEMPAC